MLGRVRRFYYWNPGVTDVGRVGRSSQVPLTATFLRSIRYCSGGTSSSSSSSSSSYSAVGMEDATAAAREPTTMMDTSFGGSMVPAPPSGASSLPTPTSSSHTPAENSNNSTSSSVVAEISAKFTEDLVAAGEMFKDQVKPSLAPGIGLGAPVPQANFYRSSSSKESYDSDGGAHDAPQIDPSDGALATIGEANSLVDQQGGNSSRSNPLGDFSSPLGGGPGPMPTVPTSGFGPGGALAAPSTPVTTYCNTFYEASMKALELEQQKKAQEYGGNLAEVMDVEGIEEFMMELKQTALDEMRAMVGHFQQDPSLIQRAGMHELRRTLHYAVYFREKKWLAPTDGSGGVGGEQEGGHSSSALDRRKEDPLYEATMRMLTVEFTRRDNQAALTPDDILFIATNVVVSNFYNRQLWVRLEHAMFDSRVFEHIEFATIKTLTTRLNRSRRTASPEGMEIRRRILTAMSPRVGAFANDFDLPALLGILQCYTSHNLLPTKVEPLAHRAINHIAECTPQECVTLCATFKRWKLMRLEVCEKLVDRICTAETISHQMAHATTSSIRTCFQRIAEGGRNAVSAEPTKQKLRALGEQIGARLLEVKWPNIVIILGVLDTLVQLKIYVPKQCMQALFEQATELIVDIVEDGHGPRSNRGQGRLITAEEARQLLAFSSHFGARELSPDLEPILKEALREGVFPDEAAMTGAGDHRG